jgi:hypothetical protein
MQAILKDKRHRRTASNVFDINQTYNGEADFMTPLVIREDPGIKIVYERQLDRCSTT